MDQEIHKISLAKKITLGVVLFTVALGAVYFYRGAGQQAQQQMELVSYEQVKSAEAGELLKMPELDKTSYDAKLLAIANLSSPTSTAAGPPAGEWPVAGAYPNANPILPYNRIVAYYGNLYSKGMGILGEYSEDEVLRRLNIEVEKWNKADPVTPVVPALHYIAVVAQAGSGKDGKYRARMPDKEIDKVLAMAAKINAIVFLDVQVGLSNVETEVPLLEKYLKLPNVHLGIDPEFSMKDGSQPGTRIGTMDAKDINFAAEYLSNLVKENNLTPKVLVVHRFTRPMVTNYKKIILRPEVQIVMNMDGFGAGANKIGTYKHFIYTEPVQFTGFKIFYKNDSVKGALLTPEQLLKLTPIPVYIQYQ